MSEPKQSDASYVSEWFGHRVYPTVAAAKIALDNQQAKRCPFLSQVTLRDVECIKSPTSKGICTISSCSNGPRQDWLVCPYRALDADLFENATRRLFSLASTRKLLIMPAPNLAATNVREQFASHVKSGGAGFVYLQDKLGGEIQLSPTPKSPQMAFDVTIVEILWREGAFTVGRYGILEVQTMDFHGSYKSVVTNLQDALRLHRKAFHSTLASQQEWLSENIEGPNIANVFKRTFYQMMVKFQLAGHGSCVGCVLALPGSVWDSWQRHLGAPDLRAHRDGTLSLEKPGTPPSALRNWIYVFDIDQDSGQTPEPIVIRKVISTNADSMSHFALNVAPEAALAQGGSADRLLDTILRRLAGWWPELIRKEVKARRARRGDAAKK